jgi:Na+/H+ antiporter NhaD/arsenite permease-like protein
MLAGNHRRQFGGAFSPIGDVTTIMLWNKGVITALGVISEILVPSIVSMIIR